MQGWRARGETLFAVVVLGGALSGCASQQNEALRLSEELGRSRADAATQQAHAAELESRLSRLEQNAAVSASERRSDERELSRRLDRLIELNARLLAEHAPVAVAPAPIAPASASPVSASKTLTEGDQLRALVEHMRGKPGRPHGGLTREQEAALQVLLRPERQLDTDALWAPAIY
jgi:hypothetical protein